MCAFSAVTIHRNDHHLCDALLTVHGRRRVRRDTLDVLMDLTELKQTWAMFD
jgi:hypothetical protein